MAAPLVVPREALTQSQRIDNQATAATRTSFGVARVPAWRSVLCMWRYPRARYAEKRGFHGDYRKCGCLVPLRPRDDGPPRRAACGRHHRWQGIPTPTTISATMMATIAHRRDDATTGESGSAVRHNARPDGDRPRRHHAAVMGRVAPRDRAPKSSNADIVMPSSGRRRGAGSTGITARSVSTRDTSMTIAPAIGQATVGRRWHR